MPLSPESQLREKLLDRVSKRLVHLLRQEENPKQMMLWAEERLFEASLWSGGNPQHKDPSAWVQQVITHNPDIWEQSLPWLEEKDSRPESARTFEGLILSLLPTEGGL
jgi:hypothetical protein